MRVLVKHLHAWSFLTFGERASLEIDSGWKVRYNKNNAKTELFQMMLILPIILTLSVSGTNAISLANHDGDPPRTGQVYSDHRDRSSQSYETENVIILVIDGVRNEEAFEEASHQYIPHIWNDMRPQGTIYTEFYTTTWTFTTSGHLSIVTGTRSDVPLSSGSTSGNAREHRPTIFEAYRKTFELPQSETWIVSGKSQLSTCDYSLHPSWGVDYGSNIEFHGGWSDIEIMQLFYSIAASDHPSLALINLKDVDYMGHNGTFDDYVNAIMRADSLAYDLWEKIQSDSVYEEKTLLIVTTDHGRNPNTVTKHGGPDHSNRHVLFLALGPDIKEGVEVTARGDLMDIASTVAELLGFDMPYSEGRILHEMLDSYNDSSADIELSNPSDAEVRLSNSAGASTFPSIDASSEGVHVVWSERDVTSDEEHRFIVYRNSTDSGNTWSDPDTIIDGFTYYKVGFLTGKRGEAVIWDGENSFLFEDAASMVHDGTPLYANVKSGADSSLIIGVNGYSILSRLVKTKLLWGVIILEKANGGEWVESGFDNMGQIVSKAPEISIADADTWITWTSATGNIFIGSLSGDRSLLRPSFLYPDLRGFGYYYRAPTAAFKNGFIHNVFELISNREGYIFSSKLSVPGLQIKDIALLDNQTSPSIDPKIVASQDMLFIIWSDYDENMWQVKLRKSYDNGDSFDEAQQLSYSSEGAWHPDIAVNGSNVVAVWEDYRDGNGEIYLMASSDGGETWGTETRLTDTVSFSAYPRVTCYDGTFYILWQDYTDGNWEIYFEALDSFQDQQGQLHYNRSRLP